MAHWGEFDANIQLQVSHDGNTLIVPALSVALETKQYSLALELLKSGASVNSTAFVNKSTPLMQILGAVKPNNPKELESYENVKKTLLNSKAGINHKDSYGNTVLHYAANNGDYELLKELLSFSNGSECKNDDGDTWLDEIMDDPSFVVNLDKADLEELLRLAGDNVKNRDQQGIPPFFKLVLLEQFQALRSINSNLLNSRTSTGETLYSYKVKEFAENGTLHVKRTSNGYEYSSAINSPETLENSKKVIEWLRANAN